MRILALDPGYGRLGIAIVEKKENKEHVLFSDCIETSSKTPFPERLHTLGIAIEAARNKYDPGAIALERLYFTNNQKTAMHVAEVRGMIIHLASTFALPVFEYTPGEIKVAVSGSGRSDKRQMMSMVQRLVHVRDGIKHDDEYDAIAVGLTCIASERNLFLNVKKGA